MSVFLIFDCCCVVAILSDLPECWDEEAANFSNTVCVFVFAFSRSYISQFPFVPVRCIPIFAAFLFSPQPPPPAYRYVITLSSLLIDTGTVPTVIKHVDCTLYDMVLSIK